MRNFILTDSEYRLYSEFQKLYSSPKLEEYFDSDDEKAVRSLTDNQKRMLLEDERGKAKRNISKILKHHEEIHGKEGREKGKKSGTKWGAGIGAAGGLITAIGATKASNKKRALLGAAMTAGGALAGAGLGRLIGADNGEASGRAKGRTIGKREAAEGGHNEIGVMTKHARNFDALERKLKKNDHWESDLRSQLKDEKKAAEEAARIRRAEELERRRVAADEMNARAQRRRAYADMDNAILNRQKYRDEREDKRKEELKQELRRGGFRY